QHVAVAIEVVLVVQELSAAVDGGDRVGQLAVVLRHRVDDVVAVGKAGHGAVGVVGDAAGVGGPAAADRGRLAQRIQGAGDRVPAGIGQDVLMPVGVVLVGHREGVPGRYRDQLGQDHAALEVG